MEPPTRSDPTPAVPQSESVKRQYHWDNIARSMPDIYPAYSTQYYRKREMALIQRYFRSLKGKRVLKLDLWNEAVNTRILNWMDSEGAATYGLDISFVTANRAHENSAEANSALRMLQSDIQAIPLRDNTFDFVYAMGTIEHIDAYETALFEVQRVLKVGGKAIIGVPHKWDVFLRPLVVRILDYFNLYLYAPEKAMSSAELRQAMARSGLKVLDRSGLLMMPGILRMVDLFFFTRRIPLYRITPFLLWPFEQLERRWEWARKLGYLLVLVAEKPES